MRFLCSAILSLFLFSSVRAVTLEIGALWHDGAFAPFVCLTDGKVAIGLMRNGTGFGDEKSIYLLWVEARAGSLGIMVGKRFDLHVQETLTTRHQLTFVGHEDWPFWGWWIGWEGSEVFARLGQILTWHGEGFALWPAVALGKTAWERSACTGAVTLNSSREDIMSGPGFDRDVPK